MARDLENWGNKGSVMIDGIEVNTFKTDFTSCNIIDVEVGTTGHQGGDTGHGGRTFFSIDDCASTDMRCRLWNNGKMYEFDNVGRIDLMFGGDSELDTLYEALKFGVEVLGRETDGVYEPSELEIRQMNFALYLNEVCNHYRKNGKLRGFSELQPKYKITPISQQQFFECELHKAVGYIPQDFCNRVYAYVLDGGKTMEAPKYVEPAPIAVPNTNRRIIIRNEEELQEKIDYYTNYLGEAYTMDEIKQRLRDGGDMSHSSEFGFSVSNKWEDKCYAFRQISFSDEEAEYEYLYITKT